MAKHKLQRFAENLTFPNLFQVSYEYLMESGFDYKGRWCDFFENHNPIALELGCGKGDYTVALARRNPHKNFIGVDIKGARLWRGAKTSNEEHMPNVAFIRTRIELINLMFGPAEVSEIWITFPDPQPKKPNKRLTSERFLSSYKKILRPGGIIHLKTDSQELHAYTRDEVIPQGHYETLFATTDLYHEAGISQVDTRDWRQESGIPFGSYTVSPELEKQHLSDAVAVQTHYESGYLAQGKPITYLQFKIH